VRQRAKSRLRRFSPAENDCGTAGASPEPAGTLLRTQKISTPAGNRREIRPTSIPHHTACCMTAPELCNCQPEPRGGVERGSPSIAAIIWHTAIALDYR